MRGSDSPARRGATGFTGVTFSVEILLADINALAGEINLCFPHLPPRAQASAVRLGHSLATLRQHTMLSLASNASRPAPAL